MWEKAECRADRRIERDVLKWGEKAHGSGHQVHMQHATKLWIEKRERRRFADSFEPDWTNEWWNIHEFDQNRHAKSENLMWFFIFLMRKENRVEKSDHLPCRSNLRWVWSVCRLHFQSVDSCDSFSRSFAKSAADMTNHLSHMPAF